MYWSHGLRNEIYIGSRSGSGTCFVAFRACAERRNFSHLESRGNKVSKMAHQAVSCSTVCLLSSRCATRGLEVPSGFPGLRSPWRREEQANGAHNLWIMTG